MKITERFWKSFAGINGFVAVVMNAVGSHALSNSYAASLAEKASIYQLIHAVMLFVLAGSNDKIALFVRWLFMAGILLFCGTLDLKAITGWEQATRLAPMGGLCFIGGWLLLALSGLWKR